MYRTSTWSNAIEKKRCLLLDDIADLLIALRTPKEGDPPKKGIQYAQKKSRQRR
jgi:hypothetical protein